MTDTNLAVMERDLATKKAAIEKTLGDQLQAAEKEQRERTDDEKKAVDAMLADLAPASANGNAATAPPAGSVHTPSRPDAAAIEALLRERQPALVSYSGWEAIDRHERELGERSGRPRVKLTDIEQMLRIAAAETPS